MRTILLADQPEYVDTIASWYFDEWGSDIPGASVESIRKKVATALNQAQIPLMVLAFLEDELAGVAELKYRENPAYPGYEHWIGGVYVEPTYRGKGVGQVLIDAIKLKAIELNVETLYLQCESNNIGLYQKQGFEALHDAFCHQVPVTIMRSNLST